MESKILLICTLSLLLFSFINCSRILVVLPTPSYSHNLVHRTIYKELSLRGHELVVFTTDPLKDPQLSNLREIDLGLLHEHSKEHGLFKQTRIIYSHPEMKRLINDTSERFDLVMVEWSVNPSFSVLSKRFECPLVGLKAVRLPLEGHDSIGNPTNPSYIPVGSGDFENHFWGRLDNFLYAIVWRINHYLFVVPEAQRLADEFFPGYSRNDILEVEKNVSIVITNTHPVITGVRPIVPANIEVGGVHLRREPKNIPKDIKTYLNNAKKGAIYVNLGTDRYNSMLDPYVLNNIILGLSELPYRVIMRWNNEDELLHKLPLNVKVWKWVPQEAILGHPNVKAFVTNGGLQSYLEAVDNEVPLIGIPLIGDQFINVRQMLKLKIGKKLDVKSLNRKTLASAVKNVAENPKYKKNIKKIKVLLHDLPMKPLEKAVWWIEYVLRHKGARHLRSPAVELDWITYLLLDVISFFIACLIVIIMIFYYIFKYLRKLITSLRRRGLKEKVQ